MKDVKSDLLTALKREGKEGNGLQAKPDEFGFMDMVVSPSLKSKSSDYGRNGLRSEMNSKDIKADLLTALENSNLNDKEGESLAADDDKFGFLDMVVSRKLKIKYSDYSRDTYDSEDKPTTFSGSRDQGRFGLSSYKSTGIYMDFSKDNDSGIHTSRRKREEGFLHGRILHCLQAKCTEEIFESHQTEPE